MGDSGGRDAENSDPAAERLARMSFGQTGLVVPRIGFGGMELAGPPRAPDLSLSEATYLVHAATDMGITYFDTSIDYGRSEEYLGKALRDRRDRVVVATKCGCLVGDVGDGERSHVFTRENIGAGVAQSLKRLGTDYIDVIQLHGNPTVEQLDREGGLEVLIELQKKGVVGHIGLSSRKPFVQEFVGMALLEVFQVPYSAVQRQHEDVVATLAADGKAVVARGVAARGSAAKSWASTPIGMKQGEAKTVWEAAGIDEIIGSMSRMEFMLRFAASNPNINILLTGTVNVSHLEENVKSVTKGPLEPDLYREVRNRLSSAGSAPGDGEYRRGGPLAV